METDTYNDADEVQLVLLPWDPEIKELVLFPSRLLDQHHILLGRHPGHSGNPLDISPYLMQRHCWMEKCIRSAGWCVCLLFGRTCGLQKLDVRWRILKRIAHPMSLLSETHSNPSRCAQRASDELSYCDIMHAYI